MLGSMSVAAAVSPRVFQLSLSIVWVKRIHLSSVFALKINVNPTIMPPKKKSKRGDALSTPKKKVKANKKQLLPYSSTNHKISDKSPK